MTVSDAVSMCIMKSIAPYEYELCNSTYYFEPFIYQDDDTLRGDIEMDEFDFENFLMNLEEKFKIEIPKEISDGFITFKDVVDWASSLTHNYNPTYDLDDDWF